MSAQITLVGAVVADPDLKFGQKGNPVLNLRVVTSRRTFNKEDNKWVDSDETYWRVVAFRQLAENCAESLNKGDRVVVVGRVKSNEWTDKEGNKRTSFEVTADNIGMDLVRHGAQSKRVARSAAVEDDPWSKPFVSVDENAPF